LAVNRWLPGVVWLVAAAAAVADDALTYSSVVRTEPRPLRIHVLKLDLASPEYQPVVVVNADPDGDGPAEAALEPPEAMASRAGLVAAVNSAVFGGLPDASGKRSDQWAVGMPVEVLGWTVADGRERSGFERGRGNLWLDATGRLVMAADPMGVGGGVANVRQATAGFGMLLVDGEIRAGEGGPLHPRTAAGIDRDGKTLILVVVDGRQPGLSEGVSDRELATFMKESGCDDAINLDGGGSSVMLISDAGGSGPVAPRVVNSPSGGSPRPLPVLLGIRRK
jgi:hypothetical protein